MPPPTNFLNCSTSLCSRSFSSLSRIVAAGLLSQLFPLDLFLERDAADDVVASATPVKQRSLMRFDDLKAAIKHF
jgi:hypothetical protein